jgi:hypothetical protein
MGTLSKRTGEMKAISKALSSCCPMRSSSSISCHNAAVFQSFTHLLGTNSRCYWEQIGTSNHTNRPWHPSAWCQSFFFFRLLLHAFEPRPELMFLCQQVPWIPKELYITGNNWVTNLTGFITIWIVRHTLQFFPNLPHMNHRISIDLANIPPTHSPEKCVIKSHTMGCPQPILGILGSSKSIGRVPGAVVGRPLWALSSSAD